MLRRLLGVLSVFSLILCVATVVLWVRSYWQGDSITRLVFFHPTWFHEPGNQGDLTHELMSFEGIVRCEWRRDRDWQQVTAEQNPSVRWNFSSTQLKEHLAVSGIEPEETQHGVYIGRFGLGYGDWVYGRRCILAVPHWLLALLMFVAPALWLRSYRVGRLRRRQGRCRNCGYDLRATPDRCPECNWRVAEGDAK